MPSAPTILRDRFGSRLEVYADQDAWLAGRDRTEHRIGGSDVAAILGVSPWASPWDVWRRKVHGIHEEITDEKQALFDRGHAAEPLVLADYENTNAHGCDPLPNLDYIVQHPDHPWLCVSPDGFAIDPALGLVGTEAKSSENLDGWSRDEEVTEITPDDDGTGKLPDSYLWQVLACLEATGLPAWDVHLVAPPHGLWPAVLALAEHRPWHEVAELIPVRRRTVRVWRDERTQAALVGRLAAWRERHLLRGEEPPVDGSDACRAHLSGSYTGDRDTSVPAVVADDEMASLITDLAAARAAKKRAEKKADRLANQILKRAGDAYKFRVPGAGVCTVTLPGKTTRTVRLHGFK